MILQSFPKQFAVYFLFGCSLWMSPSQSEANQCGVVLGDLFSPASSPIVKGNSSGQIQFPAQWPSLENAPRNQKSYTQARGLFTSSSANQSYQEILKEGFKKDLLALSSNEVWLDSGSGANRAQWEYVQLQGGSSARLISIVPELSPNIDYLKSLMGKLSPDRFFLILGQFTEHVKSVAPSSVSLITDSYGAGAYTKNLDVVLRNYLRWLKVGGRAYITISNKTAIGQFETNTYKKWFVGSEVTKTEWKDHGFSWFLKQTRGLTFRSVADGNGDALEIVIEKTAEDFYVPKLELVKYVEDTPPFRRFKVTLP